MGEGEGTASGAPAALKVAVAAVVSTLVVAGIVYLVHQDQQDQTARSTTGGNELVEPVTLASDDGVLEVVLRAHQDEVELDTVDTPVEDFTVFGYEVLQGTPSNGQMTAEGLYPGPTLKVDPGDTLIVHLANELVDLDIEDFLDPAFTPAGETPSAYPDLLTDPPYNLHTHGLHVSPGGNQDNVLLNIPAGYTNTYEYDIPEDHTTGMWWYHSHLHQLTAPQTYQGLTGLLQIGRADGDIPFVTDADLPVRNLALQYNFVFDRAGSGDRLNNPNWPQYVSTLDEPEGDELADGTYEPSLAPVNFADSAEGTQYVTNWWTGDLSVDNNRGAYQMIPTNLQRFSSEDGGPTSSTDPTAPTSTTTTADGDGGTTPSTVIEPDPDRPDHERDVQFTVNGQFQPVLDTPPGQTEIWVLANISDFAYMNVQLTETATGDHPPFAIVAQDGDPYPQVQHPVENDGTTLLIPPASRYAVAVTMPPEGDLVLEMPPIPGNTTTLSNEAILYTNEGDGEASGLLGTAEVPPESYSWYDGFFASPTQELMTARPAEGEGTTVEVPAGMDLDAFTTYEDLSEDDPAVSRTLTIEGGFSNENASTEDPRAFVYEFDSNTFPYIPLLQPRLDSVEQWTITNDNNDSHPIHIHINDFQVTETVDPAGISTGVDEWVQDNVDVPAPPIDSDQDVTDPSSVTLRTHFTDYDGTYVIHCHRLNHEDNGLMALVNVLPAVSSYAVAIDGEQGAPAEVVVYDGADDTELAQLTPFEGYEGALDTAMGDVDGDKVLDLVVAPAEAGAAEVVAYSGAEAPGAPAFSEEVVRFEPFGDGEVEGINVAADDVQATGVADNLIVGSGPGIESEVRVYDSVDLPEPGDAPEVWASWLPYPGEDTGVEVASGLLESWSGRESVVTVPGPGTPTEAKVFRFDLYEPNEAAAEAPGTDLTVPGGDDPETGGSDAGDVDEADTTAAAAALDDLGGEEAAEDALDDPTLAQADVGALGVAGVDGSSSLGRNNAFDFVTYCLLLVRQADIESLSGPEPIVTDTFTPFGADHDAGASLATGWVAGEEGGAKRIVLGELGGDGTVKVFSSGSALDGQPIDYTYTPGTHTEHVDFEEMASFEPFDGTAGDVHVATTSTSFGADLLVVGGPEGNEVRRYELARADDSATTLTASLLGVVPAPTGTRAATVGGD